MIASCVRFAIRVRPGARRTAVGGSWVGPDTPGRPSPGAAVAPAGSFGGALVVAVAAPAVDGKANSAVCAALAAAFGLRQRDVRIITGLKSRDKIVELTALPGDFADRMRQLRSRPS